MSIADPNKTILTGENPFIRLSPKDGEPNSTEASYWRIIFSPAGPGHVLYLKSELTEGRWRIYSDNIAMARWLQSTVQGMLNAELSDTTIPCADAQFSKAGDPRYFWTEHVKSHGEEISLTWFDIGEPLLIHSQPNQSPTRQTLQPEAIGAVMEVTKWLKPSISVSRIGDSASVQAVTRVNAEQASKRTMRRPTRQPFRGRLIRLGEAERRVRPAAAPG